MSALVNILQIDDKSHGFLSRNISHDLVGLAYENSNTIHKLHSLFALLVWLVSVDWSGGPAAMGMIRMGRGLTDQISKKGEMKTGTSVFASGDTLVGAVGQIAMVGQTPVLRPPRAARDRARRARLDGHATLHRGRGEAPRRRDQATRLATQDRRRGWRPRRPPALLAGGQGQHAEHVRTAPTGGRRDGPREETLRRRLSPGPVPSGVRGVRLPRRHRARVSARGIRSRARCRGATVRSRSPRTRRGRDGVARHASPIHWRHRRSANRHARPPAWPGGTRRGS